MTDLPNPTTEQVALWLKNGMSRDVVHDRGWQEVNRHFNGLTRAMRPYIQANYNTPEEQEAAFDGLTLALLALTHFEDIDKLTAAWQATFDTTPSKPPKSKPKTPRH